MREVIDRNQFNNLLKETDFQSLLGDKSILISNDDLNDPVYGEDLKIYYLLSFKPAIFSAKFSDQQIFYSIYCYFLSVVEKCKDIHGEDAGLDQQVFKLLEEGERVGNIDWSIVERLNHQVKSV